MPFTGGMSMERLGLAGKATENLAWRFSVCQRVGKEQVVSAELMVRHKGNNVKITRLL